VSLTTISAIEPFLTTFIEEKDQDKSSVKSLRIKKNQAKESTSDTKSADSVSLTDKSVPDRDPDVEVRSRIRFSSFMAHGLSLIDERQLHSRVYSRRQTGYILL
jgi:methionine aminopeptidase